MLTPQAPADGYGLGTVVNDDGRLRRFGHSGAGIGYSCFAHAWPDIGMAIAVMTNSGDALEVLSNLNSAAERHFASHSQQGPASEDPAGRYLLREDYPIDIVAADGRLMLAAPSQRPAVLQQMPNGHYRLPGLDVEISFQRADGQTPKMQLRQENRTQTATRQP